MIARFLLLLCALMAWSAAQAQTAFDPFGASRIEEKPGAAIPLGGHFLNARGGRVTLRELADGRPLLLAPVLHNCPNICGVTLAGLAGAVAGQEKKPGRDFVLVAFGIDPKETPQDAAQDMKRLRAHVPDLGPRGIYAVTGSAAEVRAVTDALGYHYAFDPRIGQYAHAAATAVIAPDGRLTEWLYGLTPRPGELGKALDAAASGEQPGWTEQLLLVCFHYDPETGRYTPAIEKIVRIAGLGTVAGIGLLLWRLRKREA